MNRQEPENMDGLMACAILLIIAWLIAMIIAGQLP